MAAICSLDCRWPQMLQDQWSQGIIVDLQGSTAVTSLVTAESRLALAALKADRDPWGPAMSLQSLC